MPFTSATRSIRNYRFQTAFPVERRTETIDEHGLSVVTTKTIQGMRGVITAGGDNALRRGADEQHMTKVLSVVTQFPLRGPAPGFQADVIQYRGDRFVVTQLDDYVAWGAGWVQATCESMDTVDKAPAKEGC